MLIKVSRGGVCVLLLLLLVYLLAGIVLLTSVSTPAARHQVTRSRHDIDVRVRSYDGNNGIANGITRQHIRVVWCRPLRFFDGFNRPTIALVSFPGSGNTWLRYLLQQATGVNTGSVYKDYGLLKNGFPGECIANSSVSVVKTHERGPLAYQGYSKAVLLVRDPTRAIQAEFNRQGGGHVGFAPPHRYKLRNGNYWAKFVEEQLSKWKKTNLGWLNNFTQPILVLFYEDLVQDLEPNLRELINFLELELNEATLKCALARREGIYRRKKKLLTVDPFTKSMKIRIEKTKQEVYWQLHTYIQNRKDENR